MAGDQIRYDLLVQEALRGVVRKVLTDAARDGLPGDHYFHIEFHTAAPGVRLSDRMRERFPDRMTIILQHTFWNLTVGEEAMEVGLSFGGVEERVRVPFQAITGFFDESVQFGLRFEVEDAPRRREAPAAEAGSRPVLPPDLTEVFLPTRAAAGGYRLRYVPNVLATARVHYVDAKSGIDQWETLAVRAPMPGELATDPWDGADVASAAPDVVRQPEAGAGFGALPGAATRWKTYQGWQKSLEEWIYRTRSLTAFRCPALKLVSRPGEAEGDFRARVALALREQRDVEVEGLRKKYEAKVTALTDKIRAAEERVAREQSQATQAKVSSTLSWGAAILGAILGKGKLASAGTVGRATTAARGMGRSAKEKEDVARAEENVDVLKARLDALQTEIADAIGKIQGGTDASALEVLAVKVAPRKGDLSAGTVCLAWVPHRVNPDGTLESVA